MDVKRYSLNDIFGFLSEATLILIRPVAVVSEDDTGNQIRTPMQMNEFIAMSLAHQLTSDDSRMASEMTTASKADVIAAMTANHYDIVAHPNYEHFGISYAAAGGGRSSSRMRSRCSLMRSGRRRQTRRLRR